MPPELILTITVSLDVSCLSYVLFKLLIKMNKCKDKTQYTRDSFTKTTRNAYVDLSSGQTSGRCG